MSVLMKGADVANAMKEELIEKTNHLKEQGVTPCLAIVRVGSRPDDLSYERGAKKRMEMIGIECRIVELAEDIEQKEFEEEFRKVMMIRQFMESFYSDHCQNILMRKQ